jgi:hypothetical protein
MSHFIGDYITHIPDLPVTLAEDSIKLGLGLWNYRLLSLTTEVILCSFSGILWWRNYPTTRRLIYVTLLTILGIVGLSMPPPRTPLETVLGAEFFWIAAILGAYWATRGEKESQSKRKR